MKPRRARFHQAPSRHFRPGRDRKRDKLADLPPACLLTVWLAFGCLAAHLLLRLSSHRAPYDLRVFEVRATSLDADVGAPSTKGLDLSQATAASVSRRKALRSGNSHSRPHLWYPPEGEAHPTATGSSNSRTSKLDRPSEVTALATGSRGSERGCGLARVTQRVRSRSGWQVGLNLLSS